MFGFSYSEDTRLICYLISAMPVAISASIMSERFGGDNLLSAQAIFGHCLKYGNGAGFPDGASLGGVSVGSN